MDEALPKFKYHPDPLDTGSVIADPDTPCLGCNRIRGYIYTGPAFSDVFHNLSHTLCPWCIADGSAAKRFKAVFNDTGTMDEGSDEARREIETRTPGFEAWQQEMWLSCCGDGAAFLGRAGASELKGKPAEALPAVRSYLKENYDVSGAELQEFVAGLSKDDMPTAYIFRCLHCQKYLAYVDGT